MSRKLPGSAIVSGSITLTQISGTLNDTTNAAYAQANTARGVANDSYSQANAAYGQANAARSDANTTFATINTTFGTVNTSLGTINTNYQAAYSQANNARSDANTTFATVNTTFGTINTSLSTINSSFSSTNTNYQAAYAQANTARDTANNAYNNSNTKLSTSGGSISGDLAITGNLTVQGNATTINVTNLSVNDSMILLATGGVGDSNDVGFVGHIQRGATDTHVGLIRKATQNQFYLFDNYEVEPTNNVIDVSGNNFRVGNLRLGIVNANSYVTSAGMDVTGQANAAYGQANAAYGQANTARDTANNAYGSANLAYTQANNARSDSNTTFATVNTTFGTTNSTFATINSTFATLNTADNNRVLKAGDTMTGTLNISNATALITTGNVGIGTTNPDAKFHVKDGWIRVTDGYGIVFGSAGNPPGDYLQFQDVGSSNNVLNLFQDGASKFVIQGVTGYVGIGVTNPGYPLQVTNSANTTKLYVSGPSVTTDGIPGASIVVRDTTAASGVAGRAGIHFQTAPGTDYTIGKYWDGTTSWFTIIDNGGIQLFTLSASGDVGIGTTNPGSKLQVVGTGWFTDSTSFGANGGQLRVVKDATSTPATLTIFGYNNLSLNQAASAIDFDLQATGTGGQTAASIRALNADDGEASAHLAFYTASNTLSTEAGGAGTERFRITSNGFIGIGTTSPAQKVDIDGDLKIRDARSLFLQRNGDNFAWRIRNESAADTTTYGYDGTNKLVFEVVSNSNTNATPGGSSHTIYASSENTLVLTEAGNVGIGTSIPTSPLHISTTATEPVRIYGDRGDTNGLFRIQIDSVSDSFASGARTFLGDGAIDIIIGTTNSSYTPTNSFIALNHGGEISMGAGSATKHTIIDTDGTLRPGSDNTYNLGSGSYRWANIFTADLNLSNKDSKNDVDGTWGEWTIQEGEENLYVINRRNGKKFKIKLEEI